MRAALDVVLRHMRLTLAVFIATAAAAVFLYATVPTGFFPQQDTGFLSGVVVTSQDASFDKASQKVQEVADIIRQGSRHRRRRHVRRRRRRQPGQHHRQR